MPDALHGDTGPASPFFMCVYVCVCLCVSLCLFCYVEAVLYMSASAYTVYSHVECILIYPYKYLMCVRVHVCVHFHVCFQDKPHRARCEHEKAAGGGLKD